MNATPTGLTESGLTQPGLTEPGLTEPGPASAGEVERRLVRVRGVVQGVGFRPFVHSLATSLGLTGQVGNDADGVFAQVQGASGDVETFCRLVADVAPPLSVVQSVTWERLEPLPENGFTIATSVAGRPGRTLVPPDVATCDACLAELRDPADRRYRHPFITCTNCGPRYTIITGLPYDRPSTTMASFPLCAACAAEYDDPADRRFHAQPVACHECGPTLALVEPGTEPLQRGAALARARVLLADGRIVTVKGIGGYHLACDATNPVAVQRLRERKQRGDKPFAVLLPDLDSARAVVELDPAAAAALASAARPVVVAPRAGAGSPVVAAVAPRSGQLGVMLPPSALHHLLFEPEPGVGSERPLLTALVLTSGNLAGEPIATDDADALTRLAPIADAWLTHDRPIHVPCDDSVVTVVDGEVLPIRRSRGYAPMPVTLPVDVVASLGVGGDLKNAFCLADGRLAWLSGHLGDMDDLATLAAFERAVGQLQRLVQVSPQRLVADRHPGYRSTQWAHRSAGRSRPGTAAAQVIQVQHHHAHVAAVMAENGLDGTTPVIGIAFDGTGYGDDGAVWGGEVLVADYAGFQRFAHLAYVPLAGGDASVARPYRMALAHLRAAGIDWDAALPPVAACPGGERAVLARQLEAGLACVPTSSMGRLFDAVASLTGICHLAGYEAQAAMELQAVATACGDGGACYDLPLVAGQAGVPWQWDGARLVRQLVDDLRDGVPAPAMAAGFHSAVARAVVEVADRVVSSGSLGSGAAGGRRPAVALSGGVFANALLLRLSLEALRARGYEVLRHRTVPPNDGGLALGQIVIGARS